MKKKSSNLPLIVWLNLLLGVTPRNHIDSFYNFQQLKSHIQTASMELLSIQTFKPNQSYSYWPSKDQLKP